MSFSEVDHLDTESIKEHHGEIIYDANGFVKKIYRKDSQLNRRIVDSWGESFHFARSFKGDTFEQSIKRHEQYLAVKLGLNEKQKALDVGCGVGGPLREIIRLSGAHVTGLNNNGYQVERCKAYAKRLGLESKSDYIKGDFTAMPRELD
ncbi:24426_t:CDS:2, partial [Racocetra persica]